MSALFLPAVASADLGLCYREDAAPFSYLSDAGEPTGYSVDLCMRVAEELNVAEPRMVKVTSKNRFDYLGKECAILCEATTMTLERRRDMEFSLIVFLTGTALLYPKELPEANYENTQTMTVGLLSDTTTHHRYLSGNLIGGRTWQFDFRTVDSHEIAAEGLRSGELQAYIADREILEFFLEENTQMKEDFQIGLRSLSYEPYALAVATGDDEIRNAIDTTLVHLFRSGEIRDILGEHVPNRRFDPLLMDLFRIQMLPD
ncbi:transporter substrate-binding domain-containing protein [Tateyamaria armeniaca]|uniref:Transporter substrate-binding domain-containing protein n=1 Tax=Tateyamaria armeniaca TaxID=2518930 RepID=A0ABW8UN16_9RHOB